MGAIDRYSVSYIRTACLEHLKERTKIISMEPIQLVAKRKSRKTTRNSPPTTKSKHPLKPLTICCCCCVLLSQQSGPSSRNGDSHNDTRSSGASGSSGSSGSGSSNGGGMSLMMDHGNSSSRGGDRGDRNSGMMGRNNDRDRDGGHRDRHSPQYGYHNHNGSHHSNGGHHSHNNSNNNNNQSGTSPFDGGNGIKSDSPSRKRRRVSSRMPSTSPPAIWEQRQSPRNQHQQVSIVASLHRNLWRLAVWQKAARERKGKEIQQGTFGGVAVLRIFEFILSFISI